MKSSIALVVLVVLAVFLNTGGYESLVDLVDFDLQFATLPSLISLNVMVLVAVVLMLIPMTVSWIFS